MAGLKILLVLVLAHGILADEMQPLRPSQSSFQPNNFQQTQIIPAPSEATQPKTINFSQNSPTGNFEQGKVPTFGGSGFGSNFAFGHSAHQPENNQVASGYGIPPTQAPGGYPSNTYGPTDQSYTYYYQHYPQSSHYGSQGEESIFSSFGDIGSSLGGLGGLGALGGIGSLGIGGIAAIAKGILAIKPFLLFGLLMFLAVPLLLLFFPIPILTISGTGITEGFKQRAGGAGLGAMSYINKLSEKVLKADECLERILCKMPSVPSKYEGKAKNLWEEYATHAVSKYSPRIARGLSAYFNTNTQNRKIKTEKCNQFKCPYKFL